jgi:GT2 family glycosyltransferase
MNRANRATSHVPRGQLSVLRQSLIRELGRLFDPRFFLNDEDVDLCRARAHRGTLRLPPVRGLVHFGGASVRSLADERRHTFRSRRAYSKNTTHGPGRCLPRRKRPAPHA